MSSSASCISSFLRRLSWQLSGFLMYFQYCFLVNPISADIISPSSTGGKFMILASFAMDIPLSHSLTIFFMSFFTM